MRGTVGVLDDFDDEFDFFLGFVVALDRRFLNNDLRGVRAGSQPDVPRDFGSATLGVGDHANGDGRTKRGDECELAGGGSVHVFPPLRQPTDAQSK
ncbi:MAG: hypothetical protein HC933_08895 [Pleurocapsa sp. SU_196_0]|nr:hypothetical protein [Pleurocapsa sp. SU_196_0]